MAEAKVNKYNAERQGKYASKREAATLRSHGCPTTAPESSESYESSTIVLVPGDGKLRPLQCIADFTYIDQDGKFHVVDCKGSRPKFTGSRSAWQHSCSTSTSEKSNQCKHCTALNTWGPSPWG